MSNRIYVYYVTGSPPVHIRIVLYVHKTILPQIRKKSLIGLTCLLLLTNTFGTFPHCLPVEIDMSKFSQTETLHAITNACLL